MRLSPLVFVAARSLLGRTGLRRKALRRHTKDPGTRLASLERPRNIQAGRGRGLNHSQGLWGAVLGIGVSLIPLLLVLVVSDGMIEGITRRYIETKTFHIQVAVPDGMDREEAAQGLDATRKVPGVVSALMETNGSAVAVSPSASNAILLRAVDPSFFEDEGTREYLSLEAGALVPKGNRDIVLGSALARTLRVSVGDQITVISPNRDSGDEEDSQDGLAAYRPRLSFFKVSGIVSAGYRDLDSFWAFITPQAGERLLVYSSCYSFFGIKVADPYDNGLGGVRKELSESLDFLYPEWFDSYLARTWPEIERSLYRSFGTTKTTLLFIMAIALLIAAINLGSSLSTFVVEHSMDIAVLRSFGATDKAIRMIFVGAGLLTGSLGTLIGLLAGMIVSLNVNALIQGLEGLLNLANSGIALLSGREALSLTLLDPAYYLEKIPVSLHPGQLGLIALLCVALSALVSLLPARKAVRISVQDLIRKS